MVEEKKDYVNYNGKFVGYIKGDTFYTKRTKEHIFKKFKSVNISQGLLYQLRKGKIKCVAIELTENNETNTYYVLMDEFDDLEEYDNKGDVQRIIPLWLLRTLTSRKRQTDIDYWIKKYYGSEDNAKNKVKFQKKWS